MRKSTAIIDGIDHTRTQIYTIDKAGLYYVQRLNGSSSSVKISCPTTTGDIVASDSIVATNTAGNAHGRCAWIICNCAAGDTITIEAGTHTIYLLT